MKNLQKTKGYITVASNSVNYYVSAINLAESIIDHFPDAKITLVTEERFLDGRERIFDKVILCDDHYRAKLWGLFNTPYDITFYMDSDIDCHHKDISKVFEELGDHDMVFTPLTAETDYAFNNRHFPEGSFQLNGGVCLYDITKPMVKEFLIDWYELYKKQYSGEWWPTDNNGDIDMINYGNPSVMKKWDQFTLWWLTTKVEKYNNFQIGIFENWARWNYFSRYKDKFNHTNGMPIVLLHYSIGFEKVKKFKGSIS